MTCFRPLTGIVVLIELTKGSPYGPLRQVSVPLRGLWFLSAFRARALLWHTDEGFRPLTGIVVLIFITINRCWDAYGIEFPSPYGDCGSYHSDLYRGMIIPTCNVSVPLRGLWFLSPRFRPSHRPPYSFPSPYGDCGSYPRLPLIDLCRDSSVSVPLRGLWFLSIISIAVRLLREQRFRPLTGIVVLIRTLYKWLYEAVEMAFCGADHIFSSFFVFCKKMIFKKSFGPEF